MDQTSGRRLRTNFFRDEWRDVPQVASNSVIIRECVMGGRACGVGGERVVGCGSCVLDAVALCFGLRAPCVERSGGGG